MDLTSFLSKMRNIQAGFINYLDNENDNENFDKLSKILTDEKVSEDQLILKLTLHLLLRISNNHHRTNNFFKKIDQILNYLKSDIQKNFTKLEILEFFKKSKRILLFLLREKMIEVDDDFVKIVKKYTNRNYHHYFAPEVKEFAYYFSDSYDEEESESELPQVFEENREKGENEKYICELIRQDSIIDFIKYVNENNISLKLIFSSSIYETNPVLYRPCSLLEYAVFYGSIQIVNFLIQNGVSRSEGLTKFAIHSANPDLIHMFENDEEYTDRYISYIKIGLKCYHSEIAKYFIDLAGDSDNFYISEILDQVFKCYNFQFMPHNVSSFRIFTACQYNLYPYIDDLFKKGKITDINEMNVLFLQIIFEIYKQKNFFLYNLKKNAKINDVNIIQYSIQFKYINIINAIQKLTV